MKTTLEIPDAIFRKAKAAAAEQGIPLREFVSVALSEKLEPKESLIQRRIALIGNLSHLHEENMRIDRLIKEEFGKVEPEDLE